MEIKETFWHDGHISDDLIFGYPMYIATFNFEGKTFEYAQVYNADKHFDDLKTIFIKYASDAFQKRLYKDKSGAEVIDNGS